MSVALLVCASLVGISHAVALPRTSPRAVGMNSPLRFTSKGTFQISIFEDLHFGERQDLSSVKVMNEILDAESQQLVVLNGDLITGENAYQFNASWYIDKIAAPLVKRNLTWASTYGNHDSSFNLSRDSILAREQRYANARTTSMVSGKLAGVSNYYLPVFPSTGGNVPCLILWFFDSRGGFYYQERDAQGNLVGQPDWVDQSVVDWFQETNAQLKSKYGRTIPSLAFVHIPTYASVALQTQSTVNQHNEPGINDDYVLAPQAQGWCSNGTNACPGGYGGQDIPFMKALTSTENLLALFSGHDHGDTWCYKWDKLLPGMTVKGNGINLCFGQHSGYGGYGTWTRGSRQILINESMLAKQVISTWIRLETGATVGAVTLNSTYNHDYYPATPNTHTSCPICNYSVVSPMPGTSVQEGIKMHTLAEEA